MKRSYSKYSAKDDLLWLILRPWIFIPRVLYILLTFIFLFLRILFQGNSKNKNVQKNLSKYLFDVITDLGPCFIKLGQALSTRPDLVRQDWLTELTNLQDNLPAFDHKIALKIIENPFKKDLLIADFGTILSITKVNSNGSIIGGQLLPGFLTQLKSMEQYTKNLKVPKKYDIPIKNFLINTEEAILKGVINSLTCVINSLFNPEKDILIICGGDSQLLTKSLKTKNENIINFPNLVMEGMIIHHLSLKKLT